MEWIVTGILIAIGIYLAPIVMGIILIGIGIIATVINETINLFRRR